MSREGGRKHAFLIAGTHSGCGKTTITLGLLAALGARGLRIQPFKVGPDFIDPGLHAQIAGVASRNLDGWMLDREYNTGIFRALMTESDLGLVEGVMGLFDGYEGGSECGSSAEMAKWLGIPAVLVVDARSMARSAAALIHGFVDFDPALRICGVIFNRIGGPAHLGYLKEAVGSRFPDIAVIGGIPREERVVIPERHLGLVTADEMGLDGGWRRKLAEVMERGLDLDLLLARAEYERNAAEDGVPRGNGGHPLFNGRGIEEKNPPQSPFRKGGSLFPTSREEIPSPHSKVTLPPPLTKGGTKSPPLTKGDTKSPPFSKGGPGGILPVPTTEILPHPTPQSSPRATIAVARDAAFCFYYPDNLELLEKSGARLRFFSPVAGDALPGECSGVYLGGGYPELFAEAISKNRAFLESLREAAARGMPIYAECGGLMSLGTFIESSDGGKFPMAGILPFGTRMLSRRKALGYTEVVLRRPCLLGPPGMRIRGHEFHYSEIVEGPEGANVPELAYELRARKFERARNEGYSVGAVLASYIHLHWGSAPEAARNFTARCAEWENRR